MKIVVRMPSCHGDKVEVEGVVLSSKQACEDLAKAIIAAGAIVWPIEPSQDKTKEKNGAGNNKK